MADHTKIEWTDSTWSPITGCTLVSDGCRNCYAAQLAATRLKNHPSRKGLARLNADGVAKFTGEVRFNEQWLDQPLRWKRPRMIFTVAHGDLFHESVPDEWIDRVFAVMALAPQHTFQVLTKRPDRMRDYIGMRAGDYEIVLPDHAVSVANSPCAAHVEDVSWPLPNVWALTSVEDQETADKRIPDLIATPAAVRGISAEPLLGPIDLSEWLGCDECRDGPFGPGVIEDPISSANGGRPWQTCLSCHDKRLSWAIVGGESGKHARPMHPDWTRSLRDQCVEAGVAFHFKQHGAWLPWEPDSPPLWRSQNGQLEDRHALFPSDFDHAPDWDDGLGYLPENGHVAFQRVGKKAAGRMLDGRTWDEFPGREASSC